MILMRYLQVYRLANNKKYFNWYLFHSNKHKGKYDEAESMLLEALRIRQMALGQDHPEVASTHTKLGDVYKRQLKYDQAETKYQDALRIYKALHGTDHVDIANLQVDLGLLFYAQKKYTQAEEMYLLALAIRAAKVRSCNQ
jgi:tetratricopeptide (TPR) repeat protein